MCTRRPRRKEIRGEYRLSTRRATFVSIKFRNQAELTNNWTTRYHLRRYATLTLKAIEKFIIYGIALSLFRFSSISILSIFSILTIVKYKTYSFRKNNLSNGCLYETNERKGGTACLFSMGTTNPMRKGSRARRGPTEVYSTPRKGELNFNFRLTRG